MKTSAGDLILDIEGVTQAYGAKRILYDVHLQIPRGQFVSLVGPSGCGKSTLFRAVVGTHLTQQGQVRVFPVDGPPEGRRVTGPGRDRGIVYQKYALFPFLTAQENVAIGLTLDRTSLPYRWFRPLAWRRKHREHLDRAAEMLRRVRLGEALNLYPHELSGGMQQRVALAQAMVLQPSIILLDEPFGALDESTREELQLMLRELGEQNRQAVARGEAPPLTLMIVTHELNEALFVGDRVVGLSQHWDWESEGHREFPGATVVYDRPAPVQSIKTARDFDQFKAQREELRRVVFEPQGKVRRVDPVTRRPERLALHS